jgi:acetyl-CoA C-acetyltransferase
MREVVVVGAARTPFGRFGSALKNWSAVELGGLAIAGAIKRAGLSGEDVEYLVMGQVLQGGCGQIPSRQAAKNAAIPYHVPSITVNKFCSSGMVAIRLASQMVALGEVDVVAGGGMESMSNAPYLMPKARWGYRMFDQKVVDLMVHDGLWCPFYDRHMAVHGSEVALEMGISRQAQDEWALRSHTRALAAMEKGYLREEIVALSAPAKPSVVVDRDEGPRPDTSLEALSKLPPVFSKEGTVTAGNAPSVNDGAGALVLMAREKAEEMGVKPLATILGHAEVSADPRYIATVPGLAVQKLLKMQGLSLGDINLLEINEAFAAVVLISARKILGMDDADLDRRVNVNGGAVALGHPIGASGARIIGSLIYELRRRGGGLGVAAICSGAAQGDALLIKVDGL